MPRGHSNSDCDDNRSDFDIDSDCEGRSVQDDINAHVSPGSLIHRESENAWCGDARLDITGRAAIELLVGRRQQSWGSQIPGDGE
ncbi:MAG: hypothetical protein RLZZ232_80 [Planctomycetota bacterium]